MTRTTRFIPALLVGLLAPALGCSDGGNVNIGDTQNLGGKLSDYAATWDGYAEAYTFQSSGSDRVRLVLDGNGAGTLRVGDNTLLAPPTDPNVGYPPDLTSGISLTGVYIGLRDDFLYPAHAAQVQTDRIQVGINPMDLEAAWCALQTPVENIDTTTTGKGSDAITTTTTSYGCLPNSASESSDANGCALTGSDGQTTPVDCGKLALCEFVMACQCTATSCGIQAPADATPDEYPYELDAALDTTGKNLTGTLNLSGTRITVHLTRQ